MHPLNASDVNKFWNSVDIKGSDECWEWIYETGKNKYGKFNFSGKQEYIHRISYELCVGEIPEGLWVLHHCDNPPCCNYTHLFIGTCADNSMDRISKGRYCYDKEILEQLLIEYSDPNTTIWDLSIKFSVTKTFILRLTRDSTFKPYVLRPK